VTLFSDIWFRLVCTASDYWSSGWIKLIRKLVEYWEYGEDPGFSLAMKAAWPECNGKQRFKNAMNEIRHPSTLILFLQIICPVPQTNPKFTAIQSNIYLKYWRATGLSRRTAARHHGGRPTESAMNWPEDLGFFDKLKLCPRTERYTANLRRAFILITINRRSETTADRVRIISFERQYHDHLPEPEALSFESSNSDDG
jgi:hypothetical protein